MIQRDKILQQLQSKRDQFVAFEDSFQDEAGRYLDALDRMSMLPGSELSAAGGDAAKLAVAFFDNSLVISFADRLQGEAQERHVRAMLELLRSSERRHF